MIQYYSITVLHNGPELGWSENLIYSKHHMIEEKCLRLALDH